MGIGDFIDAGNEKDEAEKHPAEQTEISGVEHGSSLRADGSGHRPT